MSEVISFTAGDVTIYGTLEGARAYLGMEHEDWDVASDDDLSTDQKRALVKARRFLDHLTWAADYTTFEERDAIEAFHLGSYDLAALVYDDSDALQTDLSGVTSVSAGGDSVSLSASADVQVIPGLAWLHLSDYLLADAEDPIDAEVSGQAGGEVNPFALSAEFWLEDF